MGRVVNVCISEKKGTQKHPIDEGEFIVEFGVKDDAHAGKWHRLNFIVHHFLLQRKSKKELITNKILFFYRQFHL